MKTPQRDILVLLRNEFMNEHAIEQQMECLNQLLCQSESFEDFCKAHELVDRNRITSKPGKIMSAIRNQDLKPFRFLINKN